MNNDIFKNGNVVILILSTSDKSYSNFKDSIRSGWRKRVSDAGITCYFYEGGAGEARLDGDTIHLPCDDSLNYCATKLRLALEFLMRINPECEIVYRTNLSSYIDVDVFIKTLTKLNINGNTYAGVKGKALIFPEFFYRNKYYKYFFDKIKIGPIVEFASGSGMLIGINNCLKIINTKIYDRYVDDVMVGMCLRGVTTISELDRFDFTTDNDPICTAAEYDCRVNNGLFHYRFKTNNRSKDAVLIMKFDNPVYRYTYCTGGCIE